MLGATEARAVTLDTSFAAKALFYQYPVLFLITLLTVGILVFGYAIFITERGGQPDTFTFGASCYLTYLIVISAYPADSFSRLNVATSLGEFLSTLVLLWGLFLFGLLLEYIACIVRPSEAQQAAIEWMRTVDLEVQWRNACARLLLAVYRRYRYRLSLYPAWLSQHGRAEDRRAAFRASHAAAASTSGGAGAGSGSGSGGRRGGGRGGSGAGEPS
jgi:hypothetical protein